MSWFKSALPFLLFGLLHLKAKAAYHINITSAHIISMSPPAARLGSETRAWLDAIGSNRSRVIVHKAQTGAAATTKVPIGTRIAILQGRHSHAAIGSEAALGCLLSHTAVWRSMREGDTVVVFEEDARLDELSAARMLAAEQDLALDADWDLIILETGHLTTAGKWRNIGKGNVATCAGNCDWQGSRGYILRYRGAKELLLEDSPHVQVDALFWMLAATGRLRMFWVTSNVAHPTHSASSTVWDGCLKCYIPQSHTALLLFMAFIGLIASAHVAQRQLGTLAKRSHQYIVQLRR
jgi:GR25 family glycosyltransferase involved in LPS biosynthesis